MEVLLILNFYMVGSCLINIYIYIYIYIWISFVYV